MIILLILIVLLLILIGLIYGVISVLTLLSKILINKNETVGFWKTRKYNRIVVPLSIFISITFSGYYLFSNPAHNLKTAYIEKDVDKYIVTILGKRNSMAHDPISLLKKSTYIDSSKFEIPRAEGIIDGLEIPNRPGSYKILKGEAITITNGTMKVRLFYDNYDDKKINPSNWNGDYELKWRTQK